MPLTNPHLHPRDSGIRETEPLAHLSLHLSDSWPIPTLPSSFRPFSFGTEGTILLSTEDPHSLPQSGFLGDLRVHKFFSPSYLQDPYLLLFFLFTTYDFSSLLYPPKPHPSKWIPLPLTPTQPEQYTEPALCTLYFSSLRKLGVCRHYRCEWILGQLSSVNILNMHTLGRDLSFLCVCSFKKKIIRNVWVFF